MTSQYNASDGSGVPPFRESPPFLLYSIQCLLVGLVLAPAGKRLYRVTTGLGLGLLLEFVCWVIFINHTQGDGIADRKLGRATTDIIIWATTFGFFLIGCAVGAFWWRVGVWAISACAGLAFAFSVVMMADNDMYPAARYSVLVILILFIMTACLLLRHGQGMLLASAIVGSFLLFLGIDLLANELDGMSLGLRFLLDNNEYSLTYLQSYRPPVSTRVLLGLTWLFIFLFGGLQFFLFGKRPFSPRYAVWSDTLTKSEQDISVYPASTQSATTATDDVEMQERYGEQLAHGEGSPTAHKARNSPTGFKFLSGNKN